MRISKVVITICSLIEYRHLTTAPPTGLIADFGPDSICVASSDPNNPSSTANCVVHRCVQIQGTNSTAFSLTINSMCVAVAIGLPLYCMHIPKGKLNGVTLEEV